MGYFISYALVGTDGRITNHIGETAPDLSYVVTEGLRFSIHMRIQEPKNTDSFFWRKGTNSCDCVMDWGHEGIVTAEIRIVSSDVKTALRIRNKALTRLGFNIETSFDIKYELTREKLNGRLQRFCRLFRWIWNGE